MSADRCKQCGREGVTLCTFCDLDQVLLFFRAIRAVRMQQKGLGK